MRIIIIMLALIVFLLPFNVEAANKKVKNTNSQHKETLFICGVDVYLGMDKNDIKRSIAGCNIVGVVGSSSILLKQNKDVLGVISFNDDLKVIVAYRDWIPSNSSASELVKTLADAINSQPENTRINSSVNTHSSSQPDFNSNSVNIWFQGHKSIRLEIFELKRDKQSSVSIREYLQ